MNRYLVVDLQENTILNIEKIDTNFVENEFQTSSVSCINRCDLVKELKELIEELEKDSKIKEN